MSQEPLKRWAETNNIEKLPSTKPQVLRPKVPKGTKMTLVGYNNRKIYCKETAQYVNLADIHEAIKQKKFISAKSKKTGQDITAKILKAILIQTLQNADDDEIFVLIERKVFQNESFKLLQKPSPPAS